jgi:hypothetical protein
VHIGERTLAKQAAKTEAIVEVTADEASHG